MNQYVINTPHAAVIIWNYVDRLSSEFDRSGASPSSNSATLNKVEKRIVSTVSLKSVATSKNKNTPAGSFEITLAPTREWVGAISSGSWICILMGQKPIESHHFDKADSELVKFFGRIETVRVRRNVEPESGAILTTYTISGVEWSSIFDSTLYIDPIARNPNDTSITEAVRFIYDEYVSKMTKENSTTAIFNMETIIRLWGQSTAATSGAAESANVSGQMIIKPEQAFAIPEEVKNFFGFKSTKVADILHKEHGKLSDYDKYDKTEEAIGFISPESIFGSHSVWQLLIDNCNHLLNELVVDMRWSKTDTTLPPQLTLYKRIRPFSIKSNPLTSELASKFENVRRIKIPLEKILSFEAGTNWRDKYNYVEIMPDLTQLQDIMSIEAKINAATWDPNAFVREGFRPMLATTKYFSPNKDKVYDITQTTSWKYLMREWYFDTHNLLNGTIVFTGLNEYIQVGDNILVDAKVMNIVPNINTDHTKNPNAFLLLHVESISHSFGVSPDGARSFFTTINFVRGILTNESGQQINDGRLDLKTNAISESGDFNNINVLSISEKNDPDPNKGGLI